MKYQNLLKASKQEAVPFLTAGLASEADGFLLSAEAMQNIDDALAAAEAQAASAAEEMVNLTNTNTQLQEQLNTANAALEEAQANSQSEALETANARIAELEAEVKALGSKTDPVQDTSGDDKKLKTGGPKKFNSMQAYAKELGVLQ